VGLVDVLGSLGAAADEDIAGRIDDREPDTGTVREILETAHRCTPASDM
jgi:hypothetical protein